MTFKLPILALAGFWGAGLVIPTVFAQVVPSQTPLEGVSLPRQSPADAADPAPGGGQVLLEQAVLALESRRSVSAKIRQSIDLFGKRLFGSGTYAEQQSNRQMRLRMEMRVQLGERPSSLTQVCDGRYFWTYRDLGAGGSVSRVDLARVNRVLEESGQIPQPGRIDQWPGLGGLPKLLRGLNKAFDFDSVEETQLGGQLPVWRLRGRWKPDNLAKVLPEQEDAIRSGKPVDLGKLPGYLPDHVVLFLGTEDLFPYRIEYRRREANGKNGKNRPEDRPIVTMDLFEVNLNVPIHPTRFIYSPGDREFSDQTDRFLERLGLNP